MYPFFKLARMLLKARFRENINYKQKSVLNFKAGLTDVDMFMELNNARYLTYMEFGRLDFSYRVGFLKLMKTNNWGLAVGGASIRYRRRIPLFSKFSLTTELICHDGRWFYFLHEFHMEKTICASALMKVCATSKQGLVPATEVVEKFGENMSTDVPDWVNAWINAEGQRPWPDN